MSNGIGNVEALLSRDSTKENPRRLWPFIRKVYSILMVQLILTVGVAAAVAFVPSIFSFFSHPWAGWLFYPLVTIIATFVLLLLFCRSDTYPQNLILQVIFTLCFGLVLGLLTTFIKGIIIVEAGIVAIVVIACLQVYTFWASWRCQDDLGCLVLLLQSVVTIVVSFTILQILFPTGHVSDAIYSGIYVFFLSMFIIIDTDAFIGVHSYSDCISASIKLYIGVLNVPGRLFKLIATLLTICCVQL